MKVDHLKPSERKMSETRGFVLDTAKNTNFYDVKGSRKSNQFPVIAYIAGPFWLCKYRFPTPNLSTLSTPREHAPRASNILLHPRFPV